MEDKKEPKPIDDRWDAPRFQRNKKIRTAKQIKKTKEAAQFLVGNYLEKNMMMEGEDLFERELRQPGTIASYFIKEGFNFNNLSLQTIYVLAECGLDAIDMRKVAKDYIVKEAARSKTPPKEDEQGEEWKKGGKHG
jgi:hypothetical protein